MCDVVARTLHSSHKAHRAYVGFYAAIHGVAYRTEIRKFAPLVHRANCQNAVSIGGGSYPRICKVVAAVAGTDCYHDALGCGAVGCNVADGSIAVALFTGVTNALVVKLLIAKAAVNHINTQTVSHFRSKRPQKFLDDVFRRANFSPEQVCACIGCSADELTAPIACNTTQYVHTVVVGVID